MTYRNNVSEQIRRRSIQFCYTFFFFYLGFRLELGNYVNLENQYVDDFVYEFQFEVLRRTSHNAPMRRDRCLADITLDNL